MKVLIQAEAMETNMVDVPRVNKTAGRCFDQCSRLDVVFFRFCCSSRGAV